MPSKPLVVFSLLIMLPLGALCQWQAQPSPTTFEINDILFLTQNVGFLGTDNSIYKTNDGGVSWSSPQYPGGTLDLELLSSSYIYDIHFFDQSLGILVGSGFYNGYDIVAKTTDGGATWRLVYNKPVPGGIFRVPLLSVAFLNGSVGYAVGGNGTILKTTSGGDSWTQITSSVGNNLKKVLFIDNQKGFIGGNKVLLKTTDGGLNWQATSIAFEINELLFFNSNSGIATTSEGIILSTEDGGVTWVESDINYDGMLGKAAFDGETGYVVGYEGIFNKFILKTTDGGKVWERQFPDAQNNLAGMTIAPEGKVWTGGLNGKLFSTTNGGGSSYPVASFKGYTAICENQGYTFTNNGPENKYTYEWRVDGALKSTSYDFTTAFTPGNHTVELKAIDGAISGVTQQSFNVEPSANFTRALIVEVANGLCEGSGTVFTTKDPEYGLYRLYKGTELVAEDNDYSDGVRLPVPPLQSTTTFRFTASRQNSCESVMIEEDVEVNVYNDLRVGSNIQLVQDHFCKGGVPAVQITSSREYVRYELLNNGIIVSSSTGNGNTITLQAPAIEDTTTYQVRAKVVNGACERLFDDELVVKVEKVEAAFHLSTLNAAIGEPVNVYNKSKGAVNFQWTFSNASPSASNAASPGSIIFQQAGTTQVQLEASSASGCSNVKTGDLHVYDDSFLNLSCWATGVGFSLDGDFSSQQMTNLAVAPNGDILITGYYLGEAEFDSKAGPDFTTDNEVLITNYLARYSQKGVLKWVLNTSRYMVENSINPMAGSKTVIGSDGSTYLLTSYGSFEPVFYSMDGDSIQPYKDVYIYPSSQQYLIKYSEDGILQWATSKAEITGDMLSTHFIDLEMDASGNLYLVNENIYSISPLTGDVLNSVTVFDYPPHLQNIDFIMAGDGSWYVIKRFPETIIRKYSSTGVLEWENSIDGTYESYGGSAATPQNGLALFGHSISLTEFEAQGGTSQSFNPQSIYIVKYDASGRIEWINTAIDGDLHASSIAVNEQGEISLPVQAYAGIAGTLQSQTGGDFVFAPLSSPYIVKYDQNGNIISTNKVFKEDHPMVSTIELVSRDDQTYVFGWESNNILDGVNISPPSTINGDIVHSDHGHDLFVAKFQSDCNPLPASNLSGSVVDIPPGSIVCPGMTFNVTYEVTPGVQLEADNVFSVFLVSENGSGVVEAGSVATTDASGTITAMVPENIPQGNTYKIRLWASNPKLYSDAVGSQIIIKAVAPPDFTYSSTQDLVFRLRPSVALDVDCKWTVEGQTILEHSPLYKFSTTGLIEVCLTTSDECNVERTVCKNVYVECAPVPTNYTYTVSDKTITFTGVTNPSNILNWDFGDGTTANTINTVHTFATYGSKWVCFRSSTECNQGIACKLIELACTQGDLGFGFTSAEKTVQFSNNSSADYNQFNWNFGDGTTSTDTNPSHAYTEPGTYLVTLTSTGKCSIVNTIWQQVTVQCVRPTADFQSEVNNLDVKFFDNSTNAQERLWEFGDGTTSDAISPEHHYQTAGSYQVCLISKNSCTQKKICKTINVTYPNPGIPTNLVATGIDPSTIELTWNDNSTTEQSFKILYRYSAGPFLTLTTLAANVTQFTATNLQCDETYFFKVIVIGQGMGNEVASDEVSGRTLGLNKPVVTSSATKACGGQVIELSAPDGFSNYLWTTGQNTQKISVFVTGEYAVRVGQDNCHSVFSDNVSITFEPLPDPSLFVTNNEIRVISTAEHYQWYKDNVPLPDVNTYYIIPETSGNYKVELTNNGCSAMSETVMFVITGVEEFLEDRLTIYPLPANDILFIDFDDASFKNSSGDISLISATGGTSIHVKKSHHQKTVEIDVSRLPAGLYLCVINVGEKIVHKKVIVH